MYIVPDTTIKILKNVPLDNSYKHTIFFSNKTAQQSYFNTKVKYTILDCSYQRPTKQVRVNRKADDLYDCNYIMFQNTSFGNKWFYAFITDVEYVNNETSYISFEIDVLQTWHFDYKIQPSFVEREHAETDVIGSNLVPENLEIGDYIIRDFQSSGKLMNYKIVIAATFDKNGNDATGGYYNGIYSGLCLNVFDTATEANEFIESYPAKVDGIISIFMMPEAFIGEKGSNVKVYEYETPMNFDDIDGYKPRNKKLFTYPYNFLTVSDLTGTYATFNYEYFDNDKCMFQLAGDMSCSPSVVLAPKFYKGLNNVNYNEKMVITGFPQCAFSTDAYKAWLAQNAGSLAVSTLGSTVAVVGGIATGNVAVAVGGAIGVSGTLAKIRDASVMPRQAHGGTGSNTMVAMSIKDFAFMPMTIRKEFAQIIDEYFDMFGYACHRVKVPQRSTRPHWNYVKTIDVCLTGSVPADVLAKLRKIYDSGVTFWKNGDEVGNYKLDNSIRW